MIIIDKEIIEKIINYEKIRAGEVNSLLKTDDDVKNFIKCIKSILFAAKEFYNVQDQKAAYDYMVTLYQYAAMAKINLLDVFKFELLRKKKTDYQTYITYTAIHSEIALQYIEIICEFFIGDDEIKQLIYENLGV